MTLAGHLTSGNSGHHLDAAMGLGYVNCETGESAAERFEAEASLNPTYDPKGEKGARVETKSQ